uniref:Uncharacterized protein n=1 Tax=Salix viminalis TaxID=40686 RepID=A0A6N2KS86_SALVM
MPRNPVNSSSFFVWRDRGGLLGAITRVRKHLEEQYESRCRRHGMLHGTAVLNRCPKYGNYDVFVEMSVEVGSRLHVSKN